MDGSDLKPAGVDREIDKPATAACMLVAATLILYLLLLAREDEFPAVWVLQMSLVGACCAAYGARERRGKLTALWMATTLFAILGVLAIASIGLLFLVAAGLCGVSAVRALPNLMQGR